MITIDQLLESVDLDFEPRFVTKNYCGEITIFDGRPYIGCEEWCGDDVESRDFGPINLFEFDGKDWTECIYEVPRKTTGYIKKLFYIVPKDDAAFDTETYVRIFNQFVISINELVDAVNELKGAKND